MSWKWPRQTDGAYKRPDEMTAAEKEAAADLVAQAIEDGAPGPGSDFLGWATREFDVGSDGLLRSLLNGGDPEVYQREHYEAARRRSDEFLDHLRLDWGQW